MKTRQERIEEIDGRLADLQAKVEGLTESLHSARANGEGFLTAKQTLAKVFPDKQSRPSDRWLRRLAQNGEVKSHRIGGGVFFRLSEVQAGLNGDGKPTDADFEKMPIAELWEHYEKLPHTNAKSRFYRKHIEHRFEETIEK